ncbi:hypothetical protein [Peribacillus sp. NPDC097895]|uniref:hypothetical protein n=1 Tax=Peribacillus sp. NPDC097895 TaxID=3390619 RepID=UPI003CFCDF57
MWPINNNGKEIINQPNESKMLSQQEIKAIESWISQIGTIQFLQTADQQMVTANKTLKFKYKMIGYGFNRVVYDLNNGYILKIALSEVGLISNANEAYIYNNCHEAVKQCICPVKEHGTGWIIMNKVETNVPFAFNEYTKLIKLELKFLTYGIIPIDLRLENVGYNENDEMVVTDYGLFTRWLV